MRPHPSLLVLTAIAAGCSSWPGFDRPHVELGAYLGLYTLQGRAKMQSAGAQGVQDNPGMRLSEFGLGERDDDVGGILSVGDGFSGIDLNYLQVAMRDTQPGTLSAAFGRLAPGDMVTTTVEMDEWRVRYIAKLFEHTFANRMRVELGVGAALAHRSLDFAAIKDNGDGQIIRPGDSGVPYLAARARGTLGAASINLDWAYDDGIDFGGDFDGRLQDVELTGRYEFAGQDVTLIAGYRVSDLPVKGTQGSFDYAADLRLEGFQLGMLLRF